MARRDGKQLSFLGQFWANQSDRHFQIITNVSILSVALLVWGIVFLFGLSGASDPVSYTHLTLPTNREV